MICTYYSAGEWFMDLWLLGIAGVLTFLFKPGINTADICWRYIIAWWEMGATRS